MGWRSAGQDAVVGIAAGVATAAMPAAAIIETSSLAQPAKDAGIAMVDAFQDAAEEGAAGVRDGEEAVGDEVVPEADYSALSDPPEGVETSVLADSWSEADVAEVTSDLTAYDSADTADPGTSDVGGIF